MKPFAAANFHPGTLPDRGGFVAAASPARDAAGGGLSALLLLKPFVSLGVATAAIGKSSRQVLGLIDSGAIKWAFDFGREARREIRIFAPSLQAFQNGQTIPHDFGMVIQAAFPNLPPARAGVVRTISSVALADALDFRSDHFLIHVWDKSLETVRGAECRPGRGGSPLLEFDSVIQFLKLRRLS